MINKKLFGQLITDFSIADIEKTLIYSFIKANSLNHDQSSILRKYLDGYLPFPNLINYIEDLDIDCIKTLENYIELLIPENDRKLNGAFFTPSYIVNYIIKEVSPQEKDKTIDPSCGCGAFLIGIADYYHSKYHKSIKSTVKENIYGVDILPYNIERAKLLLALFALQKNEILENCDFNLYCADSLRHKWDIEFNNIVANPPYVKFQDLSQENRDFLINKWSNTVSKGSFNLYFAFFELGYKLLKKTVDWDTSYPTTTSHHWQESLCGYSSQIKNA